jgi:hypothetical protein
VREKIVLGACVVALFVAATPVMADLAVVVSSSETKMTITSKNGDATIVTGMIAAEGPDSVLQVKIQDTITSADLDAVTLKPYNLEVLLTFTGSGNDYSATGTLKVWDRVGDTSTTPDIYGQFVSASVSYAYTPISALCGFGSLILGGTVVTMPGEQSILLPSSDPWVFQGDRHDDDIAADADGVADTIRLLQSVSNYDTGALVALHFPVCGKSPTLQDLFKKSSTIGNGDVQAVVVPLPAAVLLGMLGLGAASMGLRKFA